MTPPQSPARKNPYVGPRSFRRDAEEAKLFFGREEEARQLLVRVQSERLTLFYAESGAGKSSLLNARLIPGLEERGYVVLPVGRVSGAPPAEMMGAIDNIFAFNLMDQIDDDNSAPQRYAKATLSDFFKRLVSDDGVRFRFDPDLKPPPVNPEEAVPYVLIIDQFEEILTTHPGRWLDRENFFRQLDQAMRDDPNLWVVLSLREDFVARIEPYAPLLADRMRGRFYMQRMQEQQALDAVRLPAQQFGRPFAPEAAQALVDNLRQVRVAGEETAPGQFVEPVQLQVVCLQLWEGLTPSAGHNISLADLERLAGGRSLAEFVDQALMDFYTRSLAEVLADPAVKALPDVSEAGLRRFFSQQLITELGTRGFVLQGENQTGGLPNLVLRLLRDRYLLRAENRAGGVWYELIHDRIVDPIQSNNQAWFAVNENPLTRAAQAWEAAGRSSNKLLTGTARTEAAAQLAANPTIYGELERAFVSVSTEIDRRTEAKRQRLIISGAVALIVIFAVLAGWALISSQMAERQREIAERQWQQAVVAIKVAQEAQTAQAVAISTKDAESTASAELAISLRAALTQQAVVPSVPTRRPGNTPGEPPILTTLTPDATAITLFRTAEAQLAAQSTRSAQADATATAIAAQTTAVANTSQILPPPVLETGTEVCNLVNVNIRTTPGYIGKPSTDIVSQIPAQTKLVQLQGNLAVDGLTWWKVRTISLVPQTEGWVAFSDPNGSRILMPQGFCEFSPLSKPYVGDFPITQYFGENPDYYSLFTYDGVPLKGNTGLDIGLPVGTTVLATDDGTVAVADFDASGFGFYVRIQHSWGHSFYTNLNEVKVRVGQIVGRGEIIATSGNSGNSAGPHLGFKIRVDPYDRADGWGGFSDPAPFAPWVQSLQ